MRKRIAALLRKALIGNGKLVDALYEHELAEHIDYWYDGLQADQNEFVFAVTENSGDVAMVLITKNKTIYINEAAKAKLIELWPQSYAINMKLLIPLMAAELAADIIAVNGVKVAPE